MQLEDLAYWIAFLIPIVLMVVTACVLKLEGGGPFRREHWYLGIDLTIYFLAITLVNLLDIAKRPTIDGRAVMWTVVLVAVAILFLVIQAGIYQDWRRLEASRTQMFMLCYFANGIGILLLYGFVRLKVMGIV